MSTSFDNLDFSNSALSFPLKLFALLETDDSGLIEWVSNGHCFRIIDPDRFAAEIVPRFFKQTKLQSFQRQLNIYGFRKVNRGDEQGCYFHPKFQRGRRDMVHEIKRNAVKGILEASQEQSKAHVRTVDLAPSSQPKSAPVFPTMSKLTANIGFGKYMEQKNIVLPREPIYRNPLKISPPFTTSLDNISLPISSNFGCETILEDKSPKLQSTSQFPVFTDDLDFFTFFDHPTEKDFGIDTDDF